MRIRIASAVILFCVLGLSSCAAKKSSVESSEQPIVTTSPPFSTKEPQRYRAVRTITASKAGVEAPLSKTIIVRDGRMRREEYETGERQKIVLLEIPAGRFVLAPSAKLIAALNDADPSPQADADVSTDRLLNETAIETRYQKLGAEALNGRAATKYRVLTSGGSETSIWIDDALAMPIRWETTDGDRKTIMQLSEISLDVNSSEFALPSDYRKVDIREIYSRTTVKK